LRTRQLSKPEWDSLLADITRAPSRLPVSASPSNEVTRIAGVRDAGDRRRTITRLTVARWLHNDPHLDPRGELASVIDQENQFIAAFFTPQ
jgi:hypothetical protein